MEIDLKNRFKSKELDIKDNYNMSIDEFDLNVYKTKKKIELLNKYIHIISSLLIIISEIICQNENENFSEFNFYIRVVDLIIINNLYKNPQVIWKEIF